MIAHTHLRRYFIVIAAAGSLGLVLSAAFYPHIPVAAAILLAILLFGVETQQEVHLSGAGVSASPAVLVSFLYLFGPSTVAVGILLGGLAIVAHRSTSSYVVAFNMGSWAVAGGAAFSMEWLLPAGWLQVAAMIVVALAVALLLTSIGLDIYRQRPWWTMVGQHLRDFGLAGLVALLLTATFLVYGGGAWGLPGEAAAVAVLLLLQLGLSQLVRGKRHRTVQRLVARLHPGAHGNAVRSQWILRYAMHIGRQLNLGALELTALREAALLHDVAMEAALPGVLALARPLTQRERRRMQRHAVAAAQEVAQVTDLTGVAKAIRHHHEEWSGGGYPDGLVGDSIPMASRILAVADTFVALTNPLPYKGEAATPEQAFLEVERDRGTRLWPPAVDALRNVLAQERAGGVLAQHSLREQDMAASVRMVVSSLRRQTLRVRFRTNPVVAQEAQRQALSHLGRVVNTTLSMAEVARITLSILSSLLDCGGLIAVPQRRDPFVVRAVERLPADLLARRIDLAELAEAMDGGQTVLPEDLSADWAAVFQPGLPHMLVAAARWDERTVAAIVLGRAREWQDHEVEVIEMAAQQVAGALANASLFEDRQAKLREIENLHSFTNSVLEEMTAGLMVLDRKGRLQRHNRELRSIWKRLGFTPGPLLGVPIGRILGMVGLPEGVPTRWRRLLRQGDGAADFGEVVLPGPRGEIALGISVTPLRDARHVAVGHIVLVQDRTEHRRMQAEVRRREQLAAVGQIAAAAAHEIRNPLTAVKGFLELLQAEPDLRRMAEYLPTVLQELSRVEGLTSDMLLLARTDPPSNETCDLAAETGAVVSLLEARARELGVALAVSGVSHSRTVAGEGRRARQVVLNLLQNALDAVSDGGQIAVTLRDQGEQVLLSVADTGPGVPPEVKGRIFEPFVTSKSQGTGLGLAVCANYVHAIGGRIYMDERWQPGARIVVEWPKALSRSPATVHEPV